MSFFQKVRQGVSSAATEAERQATIARLSLDVNGTKGAIRKKQEELGTLVLQLVREGELTHPAFHDAVEEITGLERRVAEVEAHIAEIRAGDKTTT